MPGQTLEQAAAEMATLSRQFETEFPDQNKGTRYEALSLRQSLVGDTRRPLLLLLGAVGFVLLMACANVGNLMLARALGRQQELAVRLALGASPRRLAAHVLIEGALPRRGRRPLAVVIAWNAAPMLAALVPNGSFVPGLETAGVNVRVLLFALGASVVATLIFGGVACLGLMRRDSGALRERQGTLTPRRDIRRVGPGGDAGRARGRPAGGRRTDAAEFLEPPGGRSRLHAGRRADRCSCRCRKAATTPTTRVARSTAARSRRSRRCRTSTRSERRWSRR